VRYGAEDADQLTWATRESRVLVTYNIRDYVPMARAWVAEGRSHAGLLVCGQLEFGESAYPLYSSYPYRLGVGGSSPTNQGAVGHRYLSKGDTHFGELLLRIIRFLARTDPADCRDRVFWLSDYR